MSSADLATIVIACPECGTRYQVPYATLGASGREVQCAQCGHSWHADATTPPPPPIDPDTLFDDAEEDALDSVFEAAARAAVPPPPPGPPLSPEHTRTLADIRAAIAPRPVAASVNAVDPARLNRARRSFDKRLASVNRTLPLARVRRTARIGGLALLLVVILVGALLRTEIVRWYPSLAGIYTALGMPVNVVGLQFEDARTLSTLREGKVVMRITARIRSVAMRPVSVPPVLVSLLNAAGATVYEWTVTPSVGDMEPGEVMDFATEVNAPPDGATLVRLTFTESRGVHAAAPQKAL